VRDVDGHDVSQDIGSLRATEVGRLVGGHEAVGDKQDGPEGPKDDRAAISPPAPDEVATADRTALPR
jgi:hypothetical protein